MKTALIVILGIIVALVLPFLLPGQPPVNHPDDARNLPWNITVHSDGSTQVFGLSPGSSTLADARQGFAQMPEIAIIGLRDQPGSLEAFFDNVRLGPLTGKVIITARTNDDLVQAMRQRALKTTYMDSAMLRSTLTPDDLEQAQRQSIRAIVFVPAARLDETIIIQRFGPPAERRKSVGESAAGEIEHFLYPALGLDIALSARGKAQLQYVAPADFTSVQKPLDTATAR